jgi:hypothetical protein
VAVDVWVDYELAFKTCAEMSNGRDGQHQIRTRRYCTPPVGRVQLPLLRCNDLQGFPSPEVDSGGVKFLLVNLQLEKVELIALGLSEDHDVQI